MADIKIDVKFKVEEVVKSIDGLGKSIVKDLKSQLGAFSKLVYNEGLRLADQKLKLSGPIWKDNFKYAKVSDDVYEVYLVDDSIANDYEEGFEGFDMKPGFLGSGKAKTTKDGKGKYFDVPFQVQPTAKSQASSKVTDMRSAVKAVLADKTVSKKIEEFNSQSGGLARFGTVTRFEGITDSKVKGLVNIKTPSGSSKYFIFRRVSSNSLKTKWNHPGFGGAQIFPELEQFVNKGIDDLIKKVLG